MLANAVYHKSYERRNPIEVNIRPDKIEVLSFPGPLPPVDNRMLKKKRIVSREYRNRRIGDFLKEMQLTEGRATGFPKIYNVMQKNGSRNPHFETDEERTYILAILPIHPEITSHSRKDNLHFEAGKTSRIIGKLGTNMSQVCPRNWIGGNTYKSFRGRKSVYR